MINYTLDKNGKPILEPDIIKWASWYESADRRVARETIGPSDVSTVFLGINHAFMQNKPPVLWETMVFGGPLDQQQERCGGNREQAEAMHKEMCERVRASQ